MDIMRTWNLEKIKMRRVLVIHNATLNSSILPPKRFSFCVVFSINYIFDINKSIIMLSFNSLLVVVFFPLLLLLFFPLVCSFQLKLCSKVNINNKPYVTKQRLIKLTRSFVLSVSDLIET